MARVDYTEGAGAYRAARTLPSEVLGVWGRALGRIDFGRTQRVLDLGAGPGGFVGPLAEWFDAQVIAVEPSPGMREEARNHALGVGHRYPAARYLAARYLAAQAEALPLAAGSVDVAWLSTVFHQFDDRDLAAREVRRVVRASGRILVRGFFSDMEITGLFGHFPGIERAAGLFPSTDALVECFESAGCRLDHLEDVVEPWRFELRAWTERVRSMRAIDSALRPLGEDEIAEGIRVVRATYRNSTAPIASDATLRLAVFTA